jgi:hypothetical protein
VAQDRAGGVPIVRDRYPHDDRGSDPRGGDLMGDTFTDTEEIKKEMDRNADSWPDRRQD